jgi:outer membrane protein assembly factor BamB
MRWLLVILLGLAVSGCEGTLSKVTDSLDGVMGLFGDHDTSEPPAPLPEKPPELQIQTLWQSDVGDGYEERHVRLVPAVYDDTVFAADRNGLVEARDAQTGELIWEVETELPLSAGPEVHYGLVVLGTSDAEVVALNADDGESLWTVEVSSEVLALPRAAQGIIVIRTIDGRIIGLDERSGAELWSYERGVPTLSLRGTSAPAIADDRVIAGYASGKLVALRLKDGKVEWEASIALPQGRSELDRLVDIDTDPIIIDDVIYLSSFQAGLFAVSIHDGEILWQRRNLSSFAGMNADWRYLYVTDVNSDVWAVDQRSSSALWKQDQLHKRRLTAPVIHKEFVVVGDFEGYLHWLSQDDGHLVGRIQIGSDPIEAAPVVVDDVLYVYGKGGALAAVTTGERIAPPPAEEEPESEEEPAESDLELKLKPDSSDLSSDPDF